ncbi:VOC family protein [Aliagarivorans taiwanensis]|uniref:VOC family protein n=1 Tax=Aliagarivorans taiwanensis TaxID=561966 RepID=UPI000410D9C9|nr:VOC family protein [Aliagarivorans taiwanensis]
MKIEHIGLWVHDLEAMKAFYERYFGASAGERYHNPAKQFQSYFLSFPPSPGASSSAKGARLELMHRPGLATAQTDAVGWAHLAIELGSKLAVDQLSQRLVDDGYTLADGPRTTGDGYYEAVVLDPEGNRLELCE